MIRKYTILYHHRTQGDGAEGIHIAEMVAAFRRKGHDVHMVGPAVGNEGISKNKISSKFSFVKKIFIGPLYELIELLYNIYGFLALRSAIIKYNPDLIYDRYITYNYSSIAAGKKYGIPVVLEVNAPLALERDKESDEKLYFKKIAYYLEKKICSNADRTFVVSTPLMKYLYSIGVPQNTIHVLPNGVNIKKFYPKPKSGNLMRCLGISQDDVVIGFVGILRSWHGIDLLLNAIKEVCKKNELCKLLLVGDGPIRQSIVKLSQDFGIADKVIITGRISHENVSDYVALFDIAVSPKATFYASPMKIVEYMALGKPVVAPNADNIRDLLTDNVDGILFRKDSIASLIMKLNLLIMDNRIREKVAKSALTRVRNELKWEDNVDRVLAQIPRT